MLRTSLIVSFLRHLVIEPRVYFFNILIKAFQLFIVTACILPALLQVPPILFLTLINTYLKPIQLMLQCLLCLLIFFLDISNATVISIRFLQQGGTAH
jgi:hypothetical protein